MFEFQKLHGLGNHFIFFDEMGQDFQKLKQPAGIKAMCDVKYGLGADGIIFITDPTDATCQCCMQMFNVDGSEAEMCGNAIRGVAHLYKNHHKGIEPIRIQTRAGVREIRSAGEKDGACFYTVDMGKAQFDLTKTGDQLPADKQKPMVWHDDSVQPYYVHVGNPHAMLFLESKMDRDAMISMGAWLEMHPNHPRRINVEFVEVLGKQEIRVTVWERGCGMTSACGTGATACVAMAIKLGKVSAPVTVHMPGGDLFISQNESGNLLMTGPVQEVAVGQLAPSFVDWLIKQK
jgi:diaminopimelate epimerase